MYNEGSIFEVSSFLSNFYVLLCKEKRHEKAKGRPWLEPSTFYIFDSFCCDVSISDISSHRRCDVLISDNSSHRHLLWVTFLNLRHFIVSTVYCPNVSIFKCFKFNVHCCKAMLKMAFSPHPSFHPPLLFKKLSIYQFFSLLRFKNNFFHGQQSVLGLQVHLN